MIVVKPKSEPNRICSNLNLTDLMTMTVSNFVSGIHVEFIVDLPYTRVY